MIETDFCAEHWKSYPIISDSCGLSFSPSGVCPEKSRKNASFCGSICWPAMPKNSAPWPDPGTHDVFTLAIVIVGGIVVTEPLGAIAHFRHRPHWGRRLAKSPFRRQPGKKG